MHNKTKNKLDTLRKYIQVRYKDWVKEYPNVIGAYPGEKVTNNKHTGRYSIVFLVTKKQKNPPKEIPKYFAVKIPGFGKKNVPTDVIRSKTFKLKSANLADKIKRTSLNSSGTNGIFLIRGQRIFACTNAHVLLPDMIAAGKTHFFKPINEQVQPNVAITNRNGQSHLAHLQEGFFDGIDAAIARMDDPKDVGNMLPGFGRPSGIKIIKSNEEGLSLQMIGQVTGTSKGFVGRIGLTISTPIPDVFLHDLVETTIFSEKGDSGSPVFTSTLRIAGIVVGGVGETTYVLPIDKILEFFRCDLLL